VYVGHAGAALAARRARRSVGLLVLLVATYVPDWVDTGLCLSGRFSASEMLSHSIPAVLLFALVGFGIYAATTRDHTGALVVAAVILSHMLLDWITGDKPTWPGGPRIGLQLYASPIADFVVEGVVLAVGSLLYAQTLPPREKPWMDAAVMLGALLVLQLTVDIAHLMFTNLSKC
jgi:hypothetical protein